MKYSSLLTYTSNPVFYKEGDSENQFAWCRRDCVDHRYSSVLHL